MDVASADARIIADDVKLRIIYLTARLWLCIRL